MMPNNGAVPSNFSGSGYNATPTPAEFAHQEALRDSTSALGVASAGAVKLATAFDIANAMSVTSITKLVDTIVADIKILDTKVGEIGEGDRGKGKGGDAEGGILKSAAISMFARELGLTGPLMSFFTASLGGLATAMGPLVWVALGVGAALKQLIEFESLLFDAEKGAMGKLSSALIEVSDSSVEAVIKQSYASRAIGISSEEYMRSLDLAKTQVPEFVNALTYGGDGVVKGLDVLARGAGMGLDASISFVEGNARRFGEGMTSSQLAIAEMQGAAKLTGVDFEDYRKNVEAVVSGYRPYIKSVGDVTKLMAPFEKSLYNGTMSMGTFTDIMFGYTSQTMEQTTGMVAKIVGLGVSIPDGASDEVREKWGEVVAENNAGHVANANALFKQFSTTIDGFTDAVTAMGIKAGEKLIPTTLIGEGYELARVFGMASGAAITMSEKFKSSQEAFEYIVAHGQALGLSSKELAAATKEMDARNKANADELQKMVSPTDRLATVTGELVVVGKNLLETFSWFAPKVGEREKEKREDADEKSSLEGLPPPYDYNNPTRGIVLHVSSPKDEATQRFEANRKADDEYFMAIVNHLEAQTRKYSAHAIQLKRLLDSHHASN